MQRLKICSSKINKKFSNYSILDAGCRTMELKPLLKNYSNYYGSDIEESKGVLKVDLNQTIPFNDNSFDVVTCLDVLEHLDNPHLAIKELLRVAKFSLFISLPNMFHWNFRLNFLFGKGISGKYSFPTNYIVDRHRWVMSYDEQIAFIKANSSNYKIYKDCLLTINGRFKNTFGVAENLLSKIFPNLFVYGVLFEICKKAPQEV